MSISSRSGLCRWPRTGRARTALDLAPAQAARRDLYLAVFVQPTLPERADHAGTAQIVGLTALFLGPDLVHRNLIAPPFSTVAEAATVIRFEHLTKVVRHTDAQNRHR
jgi:hypothetical protein